MFLVDFAIWSHFYLYLRIISRKKLGSIRDSKLLALQIADDVAKAEEKAALKEAVLAVHALAEAKKKYEQPKAILTEEEVWKKAKEEELRKKKEEACKKSKEEEEEAWKKIRDADEIDVDDEPTKPTKNRNSSFMMFDISSLQFSKKNLDMIPDASEMDEVVEEHTPSSTTPVLE
jgi:hypothetical protein